jgi:UDP-glucuronate 4-epimerase
MNLDVPGDPVLITGVAGFIGMHVAQRLLRAGYSVIGIDNLNDYYSTELKTARLVELSTSSKFEFIKADITDAKVIADLFATWRFTHVVHLAGQVGVRHSLNDPRSYIDVNITGFLNVLESCRRAESRHLIYASSSSVYGANSRMPLQTSDNVDHPLSLYGATKKATELMSHAYAHLFCIPVTGLRFFTVYGPWGRPDMAIWTFTAAILDGRPIKLFNNGRMRRDFTYVDDVTDAIAQLLLKPAASDPAWSGSAPAPATSNAPWRVYNVGSSESVELTDLVAVIEEALGRIAIREFWPIQPGDVLETKADCTDLELAAGFRPRTSIADGVKRFVDWYCDCRRLGRRFATRGVVGT